MTKISRAFMSAGLSLFWYRSPDDVFCTSARYKALRLAALLSVPVFEFLAGIPDPSVVTTAREKTDYNYCFEIPKAASLGFSQRRTTGKTAAIPAPAIAFGSVTPARYTAMHAATNDLAQLARSAFSWSIFLGSFCLFRFYLDDIFNVIDDRKRLNRSFILWTSVTDDGTIYTWSFL